MENQTEQQSDGVRKGESVFPGYDAPIIAPELSREVLAVFAKPIYVSEAYCDDDRVSYAVESRNTQSHSGEILVSRMEQDNSPATIEINGTPAIGSGIMMSVSGPASEWCLAQTVDDHNLLTELVHQGEAVLSVYGPPAKSTPTGIIVSGEGGDDLIIPENYRR